MKHIHPENLMDQFATDRLKDALDNLRDTGSQLNGLACDCTPERRLQAAAWIHHAAAALDEAIKALEPPPGADA